MITIFKILLVTIISSSILYTYDRIETHKLIQLPQYNHFEDIAFSEKEIFVLISEYKTFDKHPYWGKSLKIQRLNYDFEVQSEIEIDNIEINDSIYHFLPNRFYINNDTLYFYGQFVDGGQSTIKYGHNLIVLKFFDDKEVFRNYEIINDGFTPNTYSGSKENLDFTKDEENIYVAFKSARIGIRKYDIDGNFINTTIVIDDSVSNYFYGYEGEVYVTGIDKINNKIYLFLTEFTNVKNKKDFYLYIYDEEFNLIEKKKYRENTSQIDVHFFEVDNKNLMVFGDLIPTSPRFPNRPSWYLFELGEDDIHYTGNNLGLNYPDYIHDIQKFGDGYLVVGAHDKIPSNPFQVSLIQKLNSDFEPIESFTFFDKETDKSNFATKVKVLNDEEYIVAGPFRTENSYYLAKFNTTLSVKNNEELEVSLFPNPSNDFITITGLDFNSNYEIIDILGNTLKVGNYSGQITISELTIGHYYLRVGEKVIKFVKSN
jgi:hypothetical protein